MNYSQVSKGVILNEVKDLTAFRDSSPSAQNDMTYSTDFGGTTLPSGSISQPREAMYRGSTH